MTNSAPLGEFDLIARLVELIEDAGAAPERRGRIVIASGDDAAVTEPPGATATSVDALVEGVHFRRETASLESIGHKALAAALSDLAAMGAAPGEAYVQLGVPTDLDEAGAMELGNGLAAAAAHILAQPASPLPTVGASGAISGILGAYLVLYPRVRVRMLFFFIIFFKVIPIPAWMVLIWWFFWQLVAALPELTNGADLSGGVAVWAHVGGFLTGVLLVKLFENRRLVIRRSVPRVSG